MPDDAPSDLSDPTAAMNPFAIEPSGSAPPAGDPNAFDPYAGLQWPPASWGIAPAAPQPTPFDASPGIVGPTPAPPMDAIAPTPVLVPALDQSLAPAPTNLAEPEPVLPAGALTPDRAPTETTGSAPINVDEALSDGQRGELATKSEETDQDRLRQKYLADPLSEEAAKYLTPQERGAALASMSPQQFAAYTITKQDERAGREAAERAQLDREKRADDERDFKALMESRAQTRSQQEKLNADVIATLKQKNPSWMESRSTLQKVAGALSAIVGGLAQGAGTGYHGPNVGLEMMQKAADDYNANQRQNQEQQRALLGQQQSALNANAQQDAQDFHDRTVHRMAIYESSKQALLSEQQKYDPQGTTSLQIGSAVRQINAQQAQTQQVYAEKMQKFNLDVIKSQQEQQKIAEAATQNRAGNALRGYEISTTRRGQDFSQQQHKDTVALERDKLAATTTEKEAAAKDKAAKDASEHTFGVSPQTKLDADGKPIGVEYGPALDKNGKVWIPRGRPEDVTKLRDKKAAVVDMVDIMDRVQRLRTGWSNSVHDREELQKISALWALNKVNFKNYAQLGALSESDYDLVDKGLGTSDPTKFLDQSAGIKEARGAIVRSLNTSMRGLDYDNPKDFEIADTSNTNAPVKDAVDMLGASINEQPGAGPMKGKNESRILGNLDQMYKIASGEGLNGKDPDTVLLRGFYQDPAARAKAVQYLKDAAENAPSERVKTEAEKLYNGVIGPQFAPGTGTDVPDVKTTVRIGDEK